MPRVIGAVLAFAVLAGCGGGGAPRVALASDSPKVNAPTSTAIVNSTYPSTVELRDAFLAAGGLCPSYSEQTDATEASSQADCNEEIVLSVYPTDAAKDRVIEFRKSTADVIGMSILVGPNWIVNAPEDTLRTVAPTLGGVLMVESAS